MTKRKLDTNGVPENGFFFRESDHMYFFDGKPMTGVTTVLNVLAKPALIQWAANEAIKYVFENGVEKDTDFILISKESLGEARTAHAKKRDKAAEQGTDIHSILEGIIKEAIEKHEGFLVAQTISDNSQVQKFLDWGLENKVKFLESERKLYSSQHFFAGTVDFTCEIEGRRYVGDIKTTSGIYDLTPFLQAGAYRLMLTEMGEPEFLGTIIVRLGKDGSFEVKERIHSENRDGETFLHALVLYREMEDYKVNK